MAAFQLGLYALGLHNCVSANWLSRTYSSHVSWITGNKVLISISHFLVKTIITISQSPMKSWYLLLVPQLFTIVLYSNNFSVAYEGHGCGFDPMWEEMCFLL